jgi:hypothetical protein
MKRYILSLCATLILSFSCAAADNWTSIPGCIVKAGSPSFVVVHVQGHPWMVKVEENSATFTPIRSVPSQSERSEMVGILAQWCRKNELKIK